MNYFKDLSKLAGNINSTLGNTLTGSNQPKDQTSQLQVQIKRRDKTIKQFEAQIKKLNEDNEFINKAYEDVEAENLQIKDSYRKFQGIVKESLGKVEEVTNRLQREFKGVIQGYLLDNLEACLGEKIQQYDSITETDPNCAPFSLTLTLNISTQLQTHYSQILQQTKSQLQHLTGKKALQQLHKAQERERTRQEQFRKQIQQLEKGYKSKVYQLEQVRIGNQGEYEGRIRDIKENYEIVVGELKNMLAKEKEGSSRAQKELSVMKLSQDKNQKVIYSKCQQNNQLITKNKQLTTQLQSLKSQLKNLTTKHTQLLSTSQSNQSQLQQFQQKYKQIQNDKENQWKIWEFSNNSLKQEIQQLQAQVQSQREKRARGEERLGKFGGIFGGIGDEIKGVKMEILGIRSSIEDMRNSMNKIVEQFLAEFEPQYLQAIEQQKQFYSSTVLNNLKQSYSSPPPIPQQPTQKLLILEFKLQQLPKILQKIKESLKFKNTRIENQQERNKDLELRISSLEQEYKEKMEKMEKIGDLKREEDDGEIQGMRRKCGEMEEKVGKYEEERVKIVESLRESEEKYKSEGQKSLQLQEYLQKVKQRSQQEILALKELIAQLIKKSISDQNQVEAKEVGQQQPIAQEKLVKSEQETQISHWLEEKINIISQDQAQLNGEQKDAPVQPVQLHQVSEIQPKEEQLSDKNADIIDKLNQQISQKGSQIQEYKTEVSSLKEAIRIKMEQIQSLHKENQGQSAIDHDTRAKLQQNVALLQAKIQEIEAHKLEIANLTKKLESQQQTLKQSQATISQLQSTLSTKTETLLSQSTNLSQLSQQLNQSRSQSNLHQQNISKLSAQIEELQQQWNRERKAYEERIDQAEVMRKGVEEKLGEKTGKVEEMEREIMGLVGDKERLGIELGEAQQRLGDLQKQLQQSQSSLEAQKTISEAKFSQILTLQQQITQLESNINQANAISEKSLKNFQQIQQKLKQVQQQKQEMQGDLQMLKEMNSSMDDQYLQLVKSQQINQEYDRLKLQFEEKVGNKLNSEGIAKIISEKNDLIRELNNTKAAVTRAQNENTRILQLKSQIEVENNRLVEQVEKITNQRNTAITEGKDLQKRVNLEQLVKDKQIKELSQKLEQKQKVKQKLQKDISDLQTQVKRLEKQVQEMSKKWNQINAELAEKEKELISFRNKKAQNQQNAKKQSQTFKNKYNKLESELSKIMASQRQLKENNQKYQAKLGDYKRMQGQWQKQKESFIQRQNTRQEQIMTMRTEVERVVLETAEKIKRQKMALQKEMLDRDEIHKAEKVALEKKSMQQLEKQKAELVRKDLKIQEAQNETKAVKSKLLQQKKVSAMLTAKIDEIKSDLAKMESVEAQSLELKKKLLMKEEELKKLFNNVNNLNSTIEELEAGIETYKDYAQQKSRQIQQVSAKISESQSLIAQLKQENKSFREKLNYQSQLDQVYNEAGGKGIEPKKSLDRKQIILPIKRLILKYFDSGATYEQKVNTLSTLSQVLQLDKKEGQILKGYRRTKLSIGDTQVKQKKEPGIQNKFFQFLTSDK